MDEVKFLKRPKLKKPYLIVAWPGMGEVAYKAAGHLVEKLKAREFAGIPAEDFFYLTASVIEDGVLGIPELPENKFYFWKNRTGSNDLIIFLSNAQPDLAKAEEYSRRIIQVAKALKVQTVISFASMPVPIDHTQAPGVWFAATSNEIKNNLKKYNFHLLAEGQISGMNGLFLGFAKKEGLKGFCLLAEIPLYTVQIENPRASQAALEALSKILGLELDFSELKDQAHNVEGEINKLLDYFKLGSQASGPINEEEIEKIKKALSQLTTLPQSVKDRIEKLFSEARADLGKAQELKAELDKWNVYKEYEDRFLDLFRRSKDKNTYGQ